jgi:ferredoxin-fold anticodon binding domain-containing protein
MKQEEDTEMIDLEKYQSAGVNIAINNNGKRVNYIGVIEKVGKEYVSLWSKGRAYSLRREFIEDVQILEEG